jgi:ankyrin repeat protein
VKIGELEKEVKLKKISEFVNLKAYKIDELTPLHFASFNGNPGLIELLVSYGANIYAVSKNGMGMIHMAA